ncbi:flagellar biosynthesis anti-sigma factor FlgM [Vibrio amylolyticus]|uniref:flagellar biosynthesis anti-sigma factor FlgM n=1 Tax=Vibrio TaxID=662 RepID=UPI000C821E41|nr:flagellar biosynthesis anti-sigma factor FlgM [Vibrio sp. 10N.261.55.A7]PMK01695.1 flagellar biosynthesis anti-sigma factor FlgM [Vibrio sp. 10N.261.55.A7]
MAGIDNIRSGQTMTSSTRSASRTESNASNRTESPEKSTGSRQDAVSLSQQGKEIGEMHNQMATQPSFDSAKVAAIKEAIANGSYTVDSEKLADNMIKFEKELGGL